MFYMPNERSNEDWLRELTSTGEVHEQAIEDLRSIILSGLPYGLSRWLQASDPRFETLISEVTQETLVRVLDRLDSFEGRSHFTTWVYTIAIRLALSELRKARWREVSLDEILEENPSFFSGASSSLTAAPENPEKFSEKAGLIERIEHIIQEELSEKQRAALIAVGIKGIPMEVVASQLDTNRNALYKLLHDARVRLKKRLEADGLSVGDILATFE
jgi:RNA polymerase sigma-70 factor (ECF subfamily)